MGIHVIMETFGEKPDHNKEGCQRGEEGSKYSSCLSFAGAGGAKVPFLTYNRILFRHLFDIAEINKLYKQAKYDWKRELFV